jgi:hypothetical protein
MEPENSENWSRPDENQNQPGASPQPERQSFFQKECLQKTWLNVKLATWLKCLIVIGVLLFAALVIRPNRTPAQPQQQDTLETSEYFSEFDEYDCYDDSYDDCADYYDYDEDNYDEWSDDYYYND